MTKNYPRRVLAHQPRVPSSLKKEIVLSTPTTSIIKPPIKPKLTQGKNNRLSDKELREKIYGNFPVRDSNTYIKLVMKPIIKKINAAQEQETAERMVSKKDTELAALSTNSDNTNNQELSGAVSLKCEEESLDDWF